MIEKPQRLAIRRLADGAWTVLFPEDGWHACQSEDEAVLLAKTRVLEYEALEQVRSDAGFANELEELAKALERHRMGHSARFFFRRAEEVRGRGSAVDRHTA